MTTSRTAFVAPKWLGAAAAGLFAAGAAARLFMPEGLRPDAEAAALALLFLGGGLTLVDAGARGRGTLGPFGVALLLCLAPPLLFPSFDATAARVALDIGTAILAAAASRALADGTRGAAWRAALVALTATTALFGVAQTLYLHDAARAVARDIAHPLTLTEQGRAFLASWRAPAVFTSPNVFGGFLLLLGPHLVARASKRSSADGWVAGIVVAAAFAAAGSAGSAMAAVLAAPIVMWRLARDARMKRLALCLALVVCAGAASLVVVAKTSQAPTGKVLTLRERLDYAAAGWRMLPDAAPFGAGLGSTPRRAPAFAAPGEASSRSLHNWWLEGFVECGVWFIPFAAALVLGAARALRAVGVETPPKEQSPDDGERARSSTAPIAGAAVGVAIAGLLHPFVVFLPPRLEWDPLCDAIIAAAGVAFVASRLSRVAARSRAIDAAAAFGFVAFLIHGLVDFDMTIAPAAAACGLAYGCLPRVARPSSNRAADRCSIIAGIVVAFAGPPMLLSLLGA